VYGVLVPVKPPRAAKSRLSSLGPLRADLAAAFAADTVAAVLECPSVSVVMAVTDDHDLASGLSSLGALVLPDGAGDDLNQTLVQAALELVRRFPSLRPAALCADLPALRSGELSLALSRAPADALGFVADAARVGTTLVVAPSVELFSPSYGGESRAAHLAAGAVEIASGDLPSLTHDVDTPADLDAARELGLGSRTSYVLSRSRLHTWR